MVQMKLFKFELSNLYSALIFRIWLSLSLRSAKYFSKLLFFKNKKISLTIQQADFFESLGLNYSHAKTFIDELCLKVFQAKFSSSNGMWSDHLVYFSGLGLSGFSPKKILEVGTFKGETSRILSEIFPNSLVKTLDLSKSDMEHKKIYSYALNSKIDVFEHRSNNINNIKNIEFMEMDSLNLINFQEEFDLIWLDGAHGYPIAAIDFANCIRLLSPNGRLVCDDVYLRVFREDPNYFSMAMFDCLRVFKEANLIDFKLILKRTELEFNFWKNQKKFVAIVEKFTTTAFNP
jgi:SAM-dependent methyltransferase